MRTYVYLNRVLEQPISYCVDYYNQVISGNDRMTCCAVMEKRGFCVSEHKKFYKNTLDKRWQLCYNENIERERRATQHVEEVSGNYLLYNRRIQTCKLYHYQGH